MFRKSAQEADKNKKGEILEKEQTVDSLVPRTMVRSAVTLARKDLGKSRLVSGEPLRWRAVPRPENSPRYPAHDWMG
jgi:hypothetical protein